MFLSVGGALRSMYKGEKGLLCSHGPNDGNVNGNRPIVGYTCGYIPYNCNYSIVLS